LGDEICISGDMFAFRHNQNTKFITYLLQATNFHRYKERYAQGAKVTRVKISKILDYKIPMPSLAEQERIVAILDKFDALVNDISIGLPAELSARRSQYEYYRGKLLTFKEYVG
jgi:type I restriction enzyme S subunit